MKTSPSPLSTAGLVSARGLVLLLVLLAAIVVVMGAAGALDYGRLRSGAAGFRPHGPDWPLLFSQSPVILAHIAGALGALLIGALLLAGVKGSRRHRTLGWIWVAAMGTAVVSSIFIRQINPGHFSFIHLFTGWTLVALPAAVFAARRHRIAIHARAMTGIFVGGLVIAGAFTFLPGRLMWRIFLG